MLTGIQNKQLHHLALGEISNKECLLACPLANMCMNNTFFVFWDIRMNVAYVSIYAGRHERASY